MSRRKRLLNPETGLPSANPRRHRRRRWPAVMVGLLLLVLVSAWFSFNGYADDWIATHGKDPTPLPAVSPYPGAGTVTYQGHLGAWYAPPGPAGATVIIVHGYGANRTDHDAVGQALQQTGYGIMAIDLGYETSAGNYGGGTREAREVAAAVAYAHAHGSPQVLLLGYSAGGTEALLAAASGGVAAVVADSSPVSFIHLAADREHIPTWFFAPASWLYGWFSSGGSLGSLTSLPATFAVPTLVIQGSADQVVDPANGTAVARLAHGTLWRVPGVGHTGTAQRCPTAYLAQLEAFFSAALAHRPFTLQPSCPAN